MPSRHFAVDYHPSQIRLIFATHKVPSQCGHPATVPRGQIEYFYYFSWIEVANLANTRTSEKKEFPASLETSSKSLSFRLNFKFLEISRSPIIAVLRS